MPAIDDGAFFAPTRVRVARRPRILAAVVALTIVGLVAVGVLDRPPAQSEASASAATITPIATLRAPTARSSRQPPTASLGVPDVGRGAADDAVFRFDVSPSGGHLFVHGDVYSLDVARVSVTLEDRVGRVEATTAVDVPGGSTAFRLGAVPRFEVHFFLTDEVRGHGFVVSATALDAGGRELATLSAFVAQSAASK